MQKLIGETLGHYRILRPIERGGMASVFLAKDIHLQREVAVKVFQPQEDQERARAFFRRFTREAQVVARLDHPNILPVYDYGEQDGLAYLVMPYLSRGSLKHLLTVRGHLSVAEALHFIFQILDALQYAHDQGLIHRDIKPGNILFKNDQTAMLADFGLVKEITNGAAPDAETGEEPTAGRQPTLSSSFVMGTPYYMAPEQIRGRVQPASDVYSLGLVLYEMLTGQRPYAVEPGAEKISIFLKQLTEPPRPIRELNPDISPQLAQVVMHVLEKDDTRRYQRPSDFLHALRTVSQQLNLIALPDIDRGEIYNTPTFDPNLVGTAPIPSALPSSGGGHDQSTYALAEDSRETLLLAESSTMPLLTQHPLPPIILAPPARPEVDMPTPTPHTPMETPGPSIKQRAGQRRITRRAVMVTGLTATGVIAAGGVAWWVLTPHLSSAPSPTPHLLYTYRHHSDVVNAVAWSPNGKRIASASTDGTVQVWDASTGASISTYRGHSVPVRAVAWSPDGKRVASAGDDGTVQVWDASTGASISTYRGHSAPVWAVTWSPNGKHIASASWDHTARVWDISTGANTYTYRSPTGSVNTVAWSPYDNKRIASASADGTVQVWDASTGASIFTYRSPTGSVIAMAWSPYGQSMASGSDDGTVQVWDASTGANISTYRGHSAPVNTVAWSPDGKRVASGSNDQTVQVSDASTGATFFTYHGHSAPVNTVAWSPDGKRIASGSNDQTVQVWSLSS